MKRIFCLLAVLTFTLSPVRAVEYLSNLTEETDEDFPAIGGGLWVAQAFTTGDSSPLYSINSITLLMLDGEDTTDAPMVLRLYSSSGNQLGAQVAATFQMTGDPSANTAGLKVWTPDSAVPLQGSTKYWVALTTLTTVGEYAWGFTNSTTYSSTDNWGIPATFTYALSENLGGEWDYLDGLPQQISIDASAVPEPSSWALLALGVTAFGLVSSRQRRA